jgi:hypothetical protein
VVKLALTSARRLSLICSRMLFISFRYSSAPVIPQDGSTLLGVNPDQRGEGPLYGLGNGQAAPLPMSAVTITARPAGADAQEDQPVVMVRGGRPPGGKIPDVNTGQRTQLLSGTGASQRASASGRGGSTSVSRLNACRRRSASDRAA